MPTKEFFSGIFNTTLLASKSFTALRLKIQKRKRKFYKFCIENMRKWTASSEFGTYRICEQRRFSEPPLLAHTSSESRGTFRQKARALASLNGWACAVKTCHDEMLEDTNSLDGAQIMFSVSSTSIFLKWNPLEARNSHVLI